MYCLSYYFILEIKRETDKDETEKSPLKKSTMTPDEQLIAELDGLDRRLEKAHRLELFKLQLANPKIDIVKMYKNFVRPQTKS